MFKVWWRSLNVKNPLRKLGVSSNLNQASKNVRPPQSEVQSLPPAPPIPKPTSATSVPENSAVGFVSLASPQGLEVNAVLRNNGEFPRPYLERLANELCIIVFVVIPLIGAFAVFIVYMITFPDTQCFDLKLEYPFEGLVARSRLHSSTWHQSLEFLRQFMDSACLQIDYDKRELKKNPQGVSRSGFKDDFSQFRSGLFKQNELECMISVRMISLMGTFPTCAGKDWGVISNFLDYEGAIDTYFWRSFDETRVAIQSWTPYPKNFILCRRDCELAMKIYEMYMDEKDERLKKLGGGPRKKTSCTDLPEDSSDGTCTTAREFLERATPSPLRRANDGEKNDLSSLTHTANNADIANRLDDEREASSRVESPSSSSKELNEVEPRRKRNSSGSSPPADFTAGKGDADAQRQQRNDGAEYKTKQDGDKKNNNNNNNLVVPPTISIEKKFF